MGGSFSLSSEEMIVMTALPSCAHRGPSTSDLQ